MRASGGAAIVSAMLVALACQAATAAAPLSSLLVQRSDLRAGYGRNVGPGFTQSPQLPDGSPLGAQVLEQHGYVLSYVAQFADYRTDARRRTVAAIVQESGDKYRSPIGAHWGYLHMIEARYPQSLPLARAVRVGDESAIYSAVLPQPPGKEIDVFFRRDRYVVRIAVASASVVPGPVLALARLVDHRIRRSG